ncbi:MAG: MerR family transcriptional regulator [Thermoleophilia bacterium]
MPDADALTINEAAETTGWSPRMLRYIEAAGLVIPQRSSGRYRLYGAAELQRLRTLRQLLNAHEVGLAEVGFALRMSTEPELARDVESWLQDTATRPDDVAAHDWLQWEQAKHTALLTGIDTTPT